MAYSAVGGTTRLRLTDLQQKVRMEYDKWKLQINNQPSKAENDFFKQIENAEDKIKKK